MTAYPAIFFTVFGMCVGSFLNVCIHRLPLRESLAWPASRCPKCQTPLKIWDNIPLISYLLLGGRCRACREPIAVKYPIVEFVTAAAFLGASLHFEPPMLYQRLIFTSAMIVLFVIDLEHRILPNVITLPGIVVGFLFSFFMPPGWFNSLLGILLGGGVLWAIAEGYYRIRGEEGMGMGDVKMLGMIGAFLGWQAMILTLIVSSLLGSIVGVAVIALKKGDMKYALPFGTFLALGAIFAAVVGDDILRWYLSFY
jgi:leader peptidase (prepilin peptidase)/N-methyltransferase